MGTRSFIAKEIYDGVIVAKYCHHDGSLSWNGVILNKFYNSEKKVDELFENSNSLISLKTSIDESKFHQNNQYPNIFKNSEEYFKNNPLENLLKISDIEYFYLFKNGNWYVKNYKETNDEVKLLDEALQETHFRKAFSILRNKKTDSLIGKELKSGRVKALKCQFATHKDEFDDSKLLFDFKLNNQINELIKLKHITSLEEDINNIKVFDDKAKNIYYKNREDFENSNDEYFYKYLITLEGTIQVIFNDKYASFIKNNEI
ncbi:hypothetical protein PQO74_000414 [Campylobacter lari]|uniref:hypothetical protein n=1 Tax=Campylobacter lari TaxID=201 RepID=UPI0012C9DA3F|nr:hypothetical protein [Campylobacter lari]EAK0799691.1 hypothetical protein [Campylobacter lari]EAL0061509.1 hypothetical protein [Campylobacter lari]EKL1317295.1 hypothetical protein [Campylobacter lari]MCV3397820.1 hypothetical protein [Campylobacter lari]MCV3419117.1 hypothetical protein [Campylobacter lari]